MVPIYKRATVEAMKSLMLKEQTLEYLRSNYNRERNHAFLM